MLNIEEQSFLGYIIKLIYDSGKIISHYFKVSRANFTMNGVFIHDMNIEKNKTFLLELPEVGSCYCMLISKNEKNYILINQEKKKLFKICLNVKNETEDYDKTVGLTKKIKEVVLKKIEESNIEYIDIEFNIEEFFIKTVPLQIQRSKISYSLYLEEREDYLNKNDWIAKTIQITSKFFEEEVIIFIYREKNTLIYGVIADLEKIAKYVFKIENNILNLIKEERYNDYQPINFLELKDEFKNLTTTSHEMQKDISSKDENEIFVMMTFKKLFGLVE